MHVQTCSLFCCSVICVVIICVRDFSCFSVSMRVFFLLVEFCIKVGNRDSSRVFFESCQSLFVRVFVEFSECLRVEFC